jgi:hypothetical protein
MGTLPGKGRVVDRVPSPGEGRHFFRAFPVIVTTLPVGRTMRSIRLARAERASDPVIARAADHRVSGVSWTTQGSGLMKIITLTLALLMPTAALAEQRQTFKDANGREVGRSVSDGRNTVFYDAMGRTAGRSVTSGGSNITYDNMGRQVGNITKGR